MSIYLTHLKHKRERFTEVVDVRSECMGKLRSGKDKNLKYIIKKVIYEVPLKIFI